MTHTNAQKPVGYIQLLRTNTNFRNLWFGQVVSLLGDWFNLIASAALIAQLTQSGLAVGGLFVVRMLAQFIMGPFGGALADRFNRKWILIITDFARAIIVLGFLLVHQAKDIWILYLTTILQLGLSGIFFPTKDAMLPDIVTEDELGTANALNSTTWSTMLALGAALGGVVAGEWGIAPSFIVDSLTFVVSGVMIWRISYTPPAPAAHTSGTVSVLQQYFDGIHYLREHGDVFVLAVQKAWMALAASSAFQVIQVEISSKVFVVGEGGSTSLGLTYALIGAGTGFSPILARAITGDREKPLRTAIMVGYGITALGLLVIAPLTSFNLVLVGMFLRGFGVAIVWVFSTQLLMQKLPGHIRGRVFGTEYALFTLMNALGAAVGGWLLDAYHVSIPTMIGGLIVLVLVLGGHWLGWGLGKTRKPTQATASQG
ncbi:MAG TPA: MFS transporter [Anaerolineales bacterium]|nr:MFS transporter [Anaerolineales bacterium]